jgi:hypothetical protein
MPCADSALRGRFDAAEAVQTPGAACSSGARGSFQHLQPPQFRPAHQLPEFSSIRAIDADAGSIARKRRPEWRPQSAVSNRRTAIGATGSEAPILSIHFVPIELAILTAIFAHNCSVEGHSYKCAACPRIGQNLSV